MPPIIRIRLSPTTTTPSAELCWPMPAKFETVKNAGLTTVPTTISSTSTGSSATSRSTLTFMPRSRDRRTAARRRDRGRACRGGGRAVAAPGASWFEIIALPPRPCAALPCRTAVGRAGQPFRRDDQLVAVEGRVG